MVVCFRESWAWDGEEEKHRASLLRGCSSVLHLFSSRSRLGDVRVDMMPFPEVTHRMVIVPRQDYRLPFKNEEFDCCIFDPPWVNQYMLWTAKEVPRVTRRRIVAITGCFWWEPAYPYRPAWTLKHVYVIKKVSPVVKLVFVWERTSKSLVSRV